LLFAGQPVKVLDDQVGTRRDATAAGQVEELAQRVQVALVALAVVVAAVGADATVLQGQGGVQGDAVALAERLGPAIGLTAEGIAPLLLQRGEAKVGVAGRLDGRVGHGKLRARGGAIPSSYTKRCIVSTFQGGRDDRLVAALPD